VTAKAKASAFGPSVRSSLNWSFVWLAIATDHLAAAKSARRAYSTNPSVALSAEFHAGLVTIAAAAFAVEAEQQRVLGKKPKTKTAYPKRANAGERLGQFLQEQGAIDAKTAKALGRLFKLRNDVTHPRAEQVELAAHPAGTNTSPELVAYSAEIAEEMVTLANKVVFAIASLSP
jgi:hypothetical protein